MNVLLKPCFCSLIFVLGFPSAQASATAQANKPNAEIWQKILTLEGKDLSQLDNKNYHELQSFVLSVAPQAGDSLSPYDSDGSPFFHGLRYLWKIQNSNEHVRYVLVGAKGLFSMRGDSRGAAFVFDEVGNLLNFSEFSLGVKENFIEVKLIKNSDLNVPLIEFITNYPAWGSEQYHAFIKDRIVLIRLAGGGVPMRNRYMANSLTKGPAIPERTPEEWEQALFSDNPAEILRTLLWIGGIHWDLKALPDEHHPSPDVKKNAELVVKVRAREGVKQRLKELNRSKNAWIREAAELALMPRDRDASSCCGPSSK